MVLGLPLSKSEFSEQKQASFRQGIADAAGVSKESVRITSIEEQRRHGRRLLAGTISVTTELLVTDASAGTQVAAQLTPANVNKELSKMGLPEASIVKSAEVAVIKVLVTTPPPAGPTPTSSPSTSPPSVSTNPDEFVSTLVTDTGVEHTVLLPDGQGVTIPANALFSATKISVEVKGWTPVLPENALLKSSVLYFGPSGTTFLQPVTLSLKLKGADAPASKRFAIYRFNTVTEAWEEKPGSITNMIERIVRVKTSSFSMYAILEVDLEIAPSSSKSSNALVIGVIVTCCLLASGFIIFGLVLYMRRKKTKTKAKCSRQTSLLVEEDALFAASVEICAKQPSSQQSDESETAEKKSSSSASFDIEKAVGELEDSALALRSKLEFTHDKGGPLRDHQQPSTLDEHSVKENGEISIKCSQTHERVARTHSFDNRVRKAKGLQAARKKDMQPEEILRQVLKPKPPQAFEESLYSRESPSRPCSLISTTSFNDGQAMHTSMNVRAAAMTREVPQVFASLLACCVCFS